MPRAPQAQRASKALLVRRFQARKAANRGWLLVFFAARVSEVRLWCCCFIGSQLLCQFVGFAAKARWMLQTRQEAAAAVEAQMVGGHLHSSSHTNALIATHRNVQHLAAVYIQQSRRRIVARRERRAAIRRSLLVKYARLYAVQGGFAARRPRLLKLFSRQKQGFQAKDRVVARYFGGIRAYPAIVLRVHVLDENMEGATLEQKEATYDLMYVIAGIALSCVQRTELVCVQLR